VERRDATVLVVLAASWGSSFLFMKVAIQDTHAITIAFGRLAVGALLMAVVFKAEGGSFPRERGLLAKLAFLGVVNNAIPFTLFAWSETWISAGLAALLNGLVPLFAVLIAAAMIREERLSAPRVLGVVVGFVGVVVAVGVWEPGFFGGTLIWLGALMAATASLLYAISTHYGRKHLPTGSPTALAMGQLTFGALALLPLSLFFSWSAPAPSAPSLVSVSLLGLVGSGFAYYLYFRLLPRIGATRLTLVTYLIPAFAIMWAFLVIQEVPTWFNIAGMGVIIAGVALVEWRARGGPHTREESVPSKDEPSLPGSGKV
jgi:drug/metabolite transporter (DMT)-like permease